ncbi:hypothetical protein [Streptomyces sp. NPDC088254]|uniref:hypothetical protein n=1 Tax=Streptomyces sp. NPDC088254 TaxID=3365847 RepID=UPI0037F606FB
MELLQHYEGLFLERAGIDGPSSFCYGLGTGELASAIDEDVRECATPQLLTVT